MTNSRRLLAFFAHPDDETLGLGSTLARYAADGVETYLLCATRGGRHVETDLFEGLRSFDYLFMRG